ncbi:calcium-binding protein [Devosia sp. PTR5]|uniref:Calcium-binding protein n=1 Tax=Devosia oryzisoli TaxID=2774138 RepID=A0A927FWU9_9HYPH|nr:calcium-binding protein [Devosia oryzisoli]MBD8066997.1 calcium-binding protein [Devosia oryzisoli]
MSELSNTSKKIINMFLYGQEQSPPDKTSSSLIRGSGQTTALEISTAEFMAGPGRFAVASEFEIIRLFFGSSGQALSPGSYSLSALAQLFGMGNNYDQLKIYQSLVSDGAEDYAERALIYNTTAFRINEGARFIVEQDGTLHVDDLFVEPDYSVQENFDFVGSALSNAVNPALENWMDPSGIGRTVNLFFDEYIPTPVSYDIDDFLADAAEAQTWTSPIWDMALKGVPLLDRLFSDGTTRYLDDFLRPIVYGDAQGGMISQDVAELAHYLARFAKNGTHLIGSEEDDIFTLSASGSIARGNGGNDTFRVERENYFHEESFGPTAVSGGDGDDELIISAGCKVVFWGGAGSDTIDLSSEADFQVGFLYDETLTESDLINLDLNLIFGGAAQTNTLVLILNPDENDHIKLDGQMLGSASYGVIAPHEYLGTDAYHEYFGYDAGGGLYYVPDSASGLVELSGDFAFENGSLVQSGEYQRIYGTFFGFRDSLFGTVFDASTPTPSYKSYWGGDVLFDTGPDYAGGSLGLGQTDDLTNAGRAKGLVVTGSAGVDNLIGGVGDDWLDGGPGADTFTGGNGNDEYVVDEASDAVVEQPNEGFDGVRSSVSFELPDNVEDVTLSGSGNIDATGNDTKNTLVGNVGNNILRGGGADDLYVYARGDGNDGIVEGSAEGAADLLQVVGVNGLTDTYLHAQGKDLLIEIFESSAGSGDDGSILIDNYLDMGGDFGVETIEDSYGNVWTKDDVFLFLFGNSAGGLTMSGTSAADTFIGTAQADELYGDDGADGIFGYAGDDILSGEGGNDIIEGGAGDDWLVGGDGADTFIFTAGFGEDGIADFAAGADVLEIHDQGSLDFAGLMADAEEWGGNAWLNFDDGSQFILHGVSLSELSASDFRFV